MKTHAVFFPFDLFGSGGTAAGAELLADAFKEMLADNRRERVATRARAYRNKVTLDEIVFETPKAYQSWRERGRRLARATLDKNKFLLWITGNHLGVLPVYDELAMLSSRGARGLQDTSTLVVQLDAHLDVYNLSDCTTELSHGNYLLHCAGPLPELINVGHRELLLRPAHVGKYFAQTFSAAELAIDPEPALAKIRQACAQAERIMLDLDCDVFDPAYFPALAHPLPFGLSPHLVLRFLDAVWSERVIGLAISEFAPARDRRDQSLATLIWLIEHVLLRRHEKSSPRR